MLVGSWSSDPQLVVALESRVTWAPPKGRHTCLSASGPTPRSPGNSPLVHSPTGFCGWSPGPGCNPYCYFQPRVPLTNKEAEAVRKAPLAGPWGGGGGGGRVGKQRVGVFQVIASTP